MVFASRETSSESQVPSSVVNSIFRSDFSGSPFFSSFLSVFFSSFLSFSCSGASCRLAPALRTAWPPRKAPAIIVRTASHAVPRRLGCFALILISSVPFSNVPNGIHGSAMPRASGLPDDRPNSGSLDAHNQKQSRQRGLYPARGTQCNSQTSLRLKSPLRFLFLVPLPTARRLRRRHDMRNPCLIHLLVQRRQIFLRQFLDLCRRFADQRSQLCQLFLLLSARRGHESVEVRQQILRLVGQRLGFPFERGPRISKPFALADELSRNCIHFFLQFISSLHDFVGDPRCVGFTCILFPLLPRRLQRRLYPFNGFAIFGGRFGHGVDLADGFPPRGAVRGRNHNPRIFFHRDFLRGFLFSRFDPDGVFPWLGDRPARSKAIPRRDGLLLFRRWLGRWIPPKIPVRAVHSRRARPVKFAHRLSIFVDHGDLYFAFLFLRGDGLRFILRLFCHRILLILIVFVFLRRLRGQGFLEVVVHNRAIGRILCDEHFLPRAPPAVAQMPRSRGARREERQGRRRHGRVHFFKRGHVIQHPDGPPVRGQYQIVFPRLDLNVVHGHRREIVF